MFVINSDGCRSVLYQEVSVKHRVLSLYLLSHGHASWGDDDISTADAFIQSVEQVIRAVGIEETHRCEPPTQETTGGKKET